MTNDTIAQVKARTDVRRLLADCGLCESDCGHGHLISCIRPDHDDKTPSMAIFPDGVKCHGCQWYGDAIDVYEILHMCSTGEAIKALAERLGLEYSGPPGQSRAARAAATKRAMAPGQGFAVPADDPVAAARMIGADVLPLLAEMPPAEGLAALAGECKAGKVTGAARKALERDLGRLVRGTTTTATTATDAPKPPDPDRHPLDSWRGRLTDAGNARLLVRMHGDDLRYCHPWAKWLAWDDTRWHRDDTGQVARHATSVGTHLLRLAATTAYRAAQYSSATDRKQANDSVKELGKWARTTLSATGQRAMLTSAQSVEGVPVLPKDLDRNPWLLSVGNGTVDLRTGDIRPHRRADLMTQRITIDYDPKATAPQWNTFLRRIMAGNEDLIPFLQRAAGYSATGHATEHVLLVAHGDGANGKSTFLETIQDVLGDYAIAAPPDMIIARKNTVHPTELVTLFHARMAVCAETGQRQRLDEVKVKRLTGADTIRARGMREDFWEFTPTHTLWMDTNHKPRIAGQDHAIWRRVRLIPFVVKISDESRILDMKARLLTESQGILAWIIAGARQWAADGLSAPDIVSEATSDYRDEEDILGAFLADHCEVAAHLTCTSKAVFKRWCEWCEETKEYCGSQREFSKLLLQRGFEPTRSAAFRGWRGLEVLGI